MDAIQALLDAANYLESRSCAVVLPRGRSIFLDPVVRVIELNILPTV